VQFKVFAWIAALRQKRWLPSRRDKTESVSEAASMMFILLKKNIGLRFYTSNIQRVFLRIFGAGLDTQDSDYMRNYWQSTVFATFFALFVFFALLVAVFVAGFEVFQLRFGCASKSSSLPK
jgi:hypothetical protein